MIKDLEYPFDGREIIKNKRKLKKALLESNENLLEKRIAVLGGSTTRNICLMMELFLLNNGIKPVFYESEYNQYYQEGLFPSQELVEFKPEIIYICTTNKNIEKYPGIADRAAEVEDILSNEYAKYESIWISLKEKFGCEIIQNNFEMPYYRVMGNMEASDIHGTINFLTRLNMKFYEYSQKTTGFHICDINFISADFGLRQWHKPYDYHMYKYAMNVAAIPDLAFNVANIIKSIYGKNKKGFVLDLDNTLWGGVVGDDGVEGIKIGPEESQGQAYSEFQTYLKKHKDMGLLLNIASKNDEENAIAGLKHPYSVLTSEDFLVIKANWNPKDDNIINIANEINILPESLVFVDDNPAERHLVKENIKNISAPEIDEVQNYIRTIDHNGYFEMTSLSEDDMKRNQMYKENVARDSLKNSFTDYGDYLKSLEMVGEFGAFDPMYISRIAQLTNKSNQFNLTTKRCSVEEIENISQDDRYITVSGKLIDRFGDNGIVTVVMGEQENDICHIRLWLMSCRVLKRDMEQATMDYLVKSCLARGVKELRGYYYPTAKNSMVKDFYEDMGFEMVSENDAGDKVYKLTIDESYEKKNHYIKVV